MLAQSYGDIELVISDNASDDATAEIAAHYARSDTRVRVHRQPKNLGAAANYNFVFGCSTGAFFKWAAHDDLIAETFVERCLDALVKHPNASLAFSNTTIVEGEGNPSERRHVHSTPWHGDSPASRLRDLLLEDESYILHCFPIAGVIRSDALRQTRLIQPFQSADKVILVELALAGDFVLVPGYLFTRRLHSKVSRRANTSPAEIARWFDARHDGSFPKPQSTLLRAYVTAVRRSRLSPWEKLRCLAAVAQWVKRGKLRVILGEQRIALREDLGARGRGRGDRPAARA